MCGFSFITEVADARDTKSAEVVEGMAYRVKRDGQVVKSFFGEFAWADAERLFTDILMDATYS